jgi:aryl-alcohol dehydrogenase-like predicted oxidoreductase
MIAPVRHRGSLSRRDVLGLAAGLGAALLLPQAAAGQAVAPLITRPIPHSGEAIPVVGLGTAYVFDDDDDTTRRSARQVVESLIAGGGRLIDTASTYGDAESVLGAVVGPAGLRDKIFLATKLESPNPSELKRSLARLATSRLDLLQLHNVRNPRQDLGQFREWNAQGICRYVGITSTTHGDFDVVETVLRREKPDFVQIDYSLDDREAEKRLLPLAAEVGAAVLNALPFGRDRLFRAVRGKPLPDWAADFDASSWPQFFLKFLIGNPVVTAVIPGTGNPSHMAEDLGAGRGRLPDAAARQRMIEFVESL